ncbi:hypothetical protein ACJ41O_005875 [Fusarium nematophilum]
MWDVVWTDPGKETRREHRERKAFKRVNKDNKSTFASSISSRSSTSSSNAASLVGFPTRRSASKRGAAPLSPTLSSSRTSPTTASFEMETDRGSSFSGGYEAVPVVVARSPGSVIENDSLRQHVVECSPDSCHPSMPEIYLNNTRYTHQPRTLTKSPSQSCERNLSKPPSPWECALSKPPSQSWERTLTKPPSQNWDTKISERVALQPCHFVQTLSEGSFIARSTEVTTTPRTPCDDTITLISEVTITANTEAKPASKPITRPRSSSGQSQWSFRSLKSRSTKPPPLPSTPRRVPSSTASLRREYTDGWKPPEAWACTPTTEAPTETPLEDEGSQSGAKFSVDANPMQHEVRRLATESNVTRLLRLKGVWGTLNNPDSWKDLDVEKAQWMLSAMFHMNQSGDLCQMGKDDTVSKTKRVLALYETPAATSYIAAVHFNKQVYHLSSAPLSPTLFPNIHPVQSPVTSASGFPIASSLFEAVYSLRLPLLTPSQEIPELLKSVHRCLEPGGALQLILIDPLPLARTLGPLLRAWIENHLLLNLETNFRCMNPTKLFPIWLANASFRVETHTVSNSKFFAVPTEDEKLTPKKAAQMSEDDVKKELRNLVGRMLWLEVWKEYIVTDYWWWEDSEILEECNRLQTTWEWRLIKAHKGR